MARGLVRFLTATIVLLEVGSCGSRDSDPTTSAGQEWNRTPVLSEEFDDLALWQETDPSNMLYVANGVLTYETDRKGEFSASLLLANPVYLSQLQPDVEDKIEFKIDYTINECGGYVDFQAAISLDKNTWTYLVDRTISINDVGDMQGWWLSSVDVKDLSGWQDKSVYLKIAFHHEDFYDDNMSMYGCVEEVRVRYLEIDRVYK